MPKDGDLAYDPAKSARVVRFFERVLVHTKGRWARSPFILTDWQRDDIIEPIFGVVRWDAQLDQWVRNYNEVWLELARKNGKSELMAGIALYMLCGDGEESAEVYGAAKDKDQAALVFNVAKRMVELSPVLDSMLKIVESRRRIVHPDSNSVYQVIPGDAEGNLGQDPSCILFDEIIAQPSRDLYDTLRTAFGSRVEPLLVCATNAGNDPESFAKLEHDEALKVYDDSSRQPNRYVYARNTPEEADPWDEKNWHHANPALGNFLNLSTLRAEAAAARQDPTKENSFRQYRLSQWVQAASRAIQTHRWDEGAGMVVADDLEGRKCFGGLDLAATTDLAAFMLIFPPTAAELEADTKAPGEWKPGDRLPAGYQVLGRYWVPEGAVEILDKSTGGKISQWEKEGRVSILDGDVIDYDPIHEQIDRDNRRFGLIDIGLDPWNSSTTIKWCEKNRIEAIPIAQTFRALSPPMKELRKLVYERRVRHGADPVLRWNIDALEVKRDHSDNERPVKPDRKASGKRVDGAVALIMALDGAIRRGETRLSAYEERGLDVV
jgi:phage terminase large subunit-like protein